MTAGHNTALEQSSIPDFGSLPGPESIGRRACDHVFTGSRAGWDAHVASVRIHPRWHPDVRDPAERKALFEDRFKKFWR